MTRLMTSIQVDRLIKQEIKALKGDRTYNDFIRFMVKVYKGLLYRPKKQTHEEIRKIRRAVANFVKKNVKFGENGRIMEIDLSD